jgi:hypothetical protein
VENGESVMLAGFKNFVFGFRILVLICQTLLQSVTLLLNCQCFDLPVELLDRGI